MVILKRDISPYVGKDIIIGVYSTTKIAEKAKEIYIEQRKISDRWSEQAYKTVNLDTDTIIEDISDISIFHEGLSSEILYLVSIVEEGFGQVFGRIVKVFSDESKAMEYANEMEKQEREYGPSWYEIEIKTLDSFDFND
jgi:hypothetical protein